mmetsp:Transcript_42196/g.47141  ORF Transcript_42196/g.47141 Transcript_42196/m.47141 type:complete len:80 (+) Transcript_42196:620-859(+)
MAQLDNLMDDKDSFTSLLRSSSNSSDFIAECMGKERGLQEKLCNNHDRVAVARTLLTSALTITLAEQCILAPVCSLGAT